jgi:MFS family permease
MSQGYIYGTFATELGKFWLGWVMAAFGASNALCSTMVGKLLAKIGCKGTITLSTVCFLICSITMAATPTDVLQQNYGVLFMCAIFLGAADAGYNTTIYAIWGAYWPKTIETAFGGFRFIQGSAIALFLGIGPVVNLTQATVLIVVFIFAGLTAVVICDRIVQPMDLKPGDEANEVNFSSTTHTEMASALENGEHYTNGTDVDDLRSVPLEDEDHRTPINGAV